MFEVEGEMKVLLQSLVALIDARPMSGLERSGTDQIKRFVPIGVPMPPGYVDDEVGRRFHTLRVSDEVHDQRCRDRHILSSPRTQGQSPHPATVGAQHPLDGLPPVPHREYRQESVGGLAVAPDVPC